jgi:hypothetical protein
MGRNLSRDPEINAPIESVSVCCVSPKPKAQGTAGDSPKKIRATLCQLRPGPLIRGIPAAVKRGKKRCMSFLSVPAEKMARGTASQDAGYGEPSTRSPQGLFSSCERRSKGATKHLSGGKGHTYR